MITEAVVISLIVGFIRGGKISNIANLPLRKAWLIAIPGCVLVVFYVAKVLGSSFAGQAAHYLHQVVYIFVLSALCFNFRIPGVIPLFIGSLTNAITAFANGGDMPVSLAAVNAAGMTEHAQLLKNGDLVRHVLMTEKTRLNFLADIIPTPRPPFPFPGVHSIGDLLVAAGLFIIIQYSMCPGKRRGVGNTIAGQNKT